MARSSIPVLLLSCTLAGCPFAPREDDREGDDEPRGEPDVETPDDADDDPHVVPDDDDDEAPRLAPEIGLGDHTPSSVELVVVADHEDLREPTGLGFPSDRPGDLWIVNRADDAWTIINEVGTPAQSIDVFWDDSNHFLNAPTSITFSGDESVAVTCQENDNDLNGLQPGDLWMGPVAWTTDREYFEGGHLSHYDMAHEQPFCMGVAWSEDRVFWAFNDYDDSIDRIDFHDWHPDQGADAPDGWPEGLAGENHFDGEIWRYVAGDVQGVAGVPSHMVHDADERLLYVADTGHGRIVTLDTKPQEGHWALPRFGEMAFFVVDHIELEELVPPGTVAQPSGMALHAGLLYVTDHADGRILAFTKSGELVNWLDTGLGGGAITGIAISRDGVVYFLDTANDRLYEVRP